MVFISGPIEQENWDTPDGQKRSKLVVNLVSIKKMPTGEKTNNGDTGDSPKAAAPASKKSPAGKKPANTVPVPEDATPEGGPDEDIPF
jgi:single-stranded DNA-binding protein